MYNVCTTCIAAVLEGQERELHPPGTAVIDGCELLLWGQPVLLTAAP